MTTQADPKNDDNHDYRQCQCGCHDARQLDDRDVPRVVTRCAELGSWRRRAVRAGRAITTSAVIAKAITDAGSLIDLVR